MDPSSFFLQLDGLLPNPWGSLGRCAGLNRFSRKAAKTAKGLIWRRCVRIGKRASVGLLKKLFSCYPESQAIGTKDLDQMGILP